MTFSGRAQVAVAVAVWAALPAPAANAQPTSPEVTLVIEGCTLEQVDGDALRRMVRMEVGQAGRAPSQAPKARLVCNGDLVRVEIGGPGGESARRDVDLRREPERTRSRLLALAIVEAVTGHAEPTAPPTERSPPPPEPASVVARKAPAASRAARPASAYPRRGFGLSVAAIGRQFTSGPLHLGAAVSPEWHTGRFILVAEAAVEGASAEFRDPFLTRVRTLALSMAPQAWLRASRGLLDVAGGGGMRLGFVRLSGESLAGCGEVRVFEALWGGPVIGLHAHYRPASVLRVGLGAEAGLVVFGVVGEVAREQIRLSGAWVGLQVSVAFVQQ